MLIHTIVFVTLSILSAIAIYAAGMPIPKSSPKSDELDAHTTDSIHAETRCCA
jgi:hypothetical protein